MDDRNSPSLVDGPPQAAATATTMKALLLGWLEREGPFGSSEAPDQRADPRVVKGVKADTGALKVIVDA